MLYFYNYNYCTLLFLITVLFHSVYFHLCPDPGTGGIGDTVIVDTSLYKYKYENYENCVHQWRSFKHHFKYILSISAWLKNVLKASIWALQCFKIITNLSACVLSLKASASINIWVLNCPMPNYSCVPDSRTASNMYSTVEPMN